MPPIDPIERAHLTGVSSPSPPIYRYAPSADLVDLVDRYWIPVWSVAEPQTQSTLQHPVCLLVVSNTYARFYGVVRGRSSVSLEGDGFAVGVRFTPAAGRLILGDSVQTVTDTYLDLDDVDAFDSPELSRNVREAMAADAHSESAHQSAIAALETALRELPAVDDEGLLINRIVNWLTANPDATRVADVTEAFEINERTLQRLVLRRTGLTPKWLIQRRRLHDAVVGLKSGRASLSSLAADLGYVDQAHFTHDFRTVVGQTPGEFLADQPGAG